MRSKSVKWSTSAHEVRYLIFAAIAAALFVITAITVNDNHSPEVEQAIFHAVNSLPAFIYWPFWAVMQVGNLIAIPVAALASTVLRRFKLAAGIVLAGVTKLYVARAIKSEVLRERPASVIDDVIRRGDASAAGKAFVSGHALIAFAIATLASPYLTRRWKLVLWSVASLVCLGRVYVGAHLPLDVVGGAAVGWGLGSLINFALGVPEAASPAERTTVAEAQPGGPLLE